MPEPVQTEQTPRRRVVADLAELLLALPDAQCRHAIAAALEALHPQAADMQEA